MNELMIFEGHEVEAFEFNGQVLFNPYHVGECLELVESSVRNYLAKMNDKQTIRLKNSDVRNKDIQNSDVGLTNFRKLNNAGENFLTESGIYKLVFKSRKPNAEAFTDWVTDEVLPTLRKTGSYSSQKKSPLELLELEFAAIKEVDTKIDAVNRDLQDFKMDMPLLGVETDKITAAVHRRGVNVLGGKDSNAYSDRSLHGKVFSDIHRELKRQFEVTTYKAIKRSQCDMAVRIIEAYEPPFVLAEQIADCNAQVNMEVA